MNYLKLFALAACVAFLGACNGNDNTQQQQQAPVAQEQPGVQPQQPAAPADPNAQQPQATAQALPATATNFLQQQFPNATVTYVETDSDDGRIEYETTLNDGTKVTFNAAGEWDKVECYGKAVPAALVPANIASYVSTNYQGAAITKVDREPYGFDIDLANGLDLKFNANGQLMSVDD
ncbi:MAG: PepSY-like domain-containing protein [Muribaculaceae bacterium]|nr:PepSY-like domain-containing protein [Muribaculaceae bacterium]